MAIMFNLLIFIILIVGGTLLQIFLSRRAAAWPGLILPGITFLYSLIAILGAAIYGGMTIAQTFGNIVTTFLIFNLPTLVLLAIYFACREKTRRKAQLDKMNIQDLE